MPVYPGIVGSIVIKEQDSLVTFQRFDFTDQDDKNGIYSGNYKIWSVKYTNFDLFSKFLLE